MFTSRRELAGWVAVTVGVGLQLRYDVLRLLIERYKDRFQADSDALVYSALADPDRGLLDPLLRPSGEDYTSQFGLQGVVMALASPGAQFYGAFRLGTALLLAAVIATAVVACRRAWGGFAAAVLLVLLTASTWLNAFGPSTYWQAWTLLLPMLVPLLVWPRLGIGRRTWVRGGPLIAGLVFLKCLNGYEFITTVVLGVAAVVAFHEYRGTVDRRLLTRLVAAMAAAVGGFAAALAVHAAQLRALYGDAAAVIAGRAGDRTFWPTTNDDVVRRVAKQAGPVGDWLLERNEALTIWLFRMRYFLSDPAVSLPAPRALGFGPLPYEIPIYLFIGAFALLAWRAHRGRGVDAALQRRLALSAGIALAGALSWLVLAFGHMTVHPHIDAIVFYLPFLPLVFAMLAVRLAAIRGRLRPAGGGTDAVTIPAAGGDTRDGDQRDHHRHDQRGDMHDRDRTQLSGDPLLAGAGVSR